MSEDLDAKLAELRAAYASRLPDKLAELERALEAARAAGRASPEHHVAKRLAHRLHGTAGTYGLTEVSDEAGLIEDELECMANTGNDSWPAVEAALARLRSNSETDP